MASNGTLVSKIDLDDLIASCQIGQEAPSDPNVLVERREDGIELWETVGWIGRKSVNKVLKDIGIPHTYVYPSFTRVSDISVVAAYYNVNRVRDGESGLDRVLINLTRMAEIDKRNEAKGKMRKDLGLINRSESEEEKLARNLRSLGQSVAGKKGKRVKLSSAKLAAAQQQIDALMRQLAGEEETVEEEEEASE
jgi:hypothetical protein